MIIKLHAYLPLVGVDDVLAVSKHGDTLTINGDVYDFSAIPEGATLPANAIECRNIFGPVDRIDGEIHLTLCFPISADASEAARFPEPIINPADGILELPQ